MEFKESSRVELREIIHTDFKKEIIAFANTDGGEIYVGVTSSGQPVGVENCEKEMERITSMIHDGIHPDLIPFTSVEALKTEGKELIRVSVSRGERRPYHLSDRGMKPSGVYVRHGVASVPASEEMIRQMIRESDGVCYDKARSMNQNLTFDYTAKYFEKCGVGFSRENQRTLGLIDDDGYYTNAALLLSDQCEHTIKCAVFSGNTKMVFKTREEFGGSILQQMEEVYRYLSLQNNRRVEFEGLRRIETLDYPEPALREALLNAVVHRDYDYSGSILVSIFDNRMECVSPGGLVKGILAEDMYRGVSQPRNTVIANIFYRLELIESYGTGVPRMMDSYAGVNGKPDFYMSSGCFIVTLPNRQYLQPEYAPLRMEEESEGLILRDTSPEGRVLALIERKETISRRDVEELLGCSSFPARNILRSLIAKKLITPFGNARATRYRIAEESDI